MSSRFPNTRADAAKELVARVVRSGDEFLVPSLNSDRVYRVRLVGGEPTCNCADFLNRGKACKHVLASAMHAEKQQTQTSEVQ